jgi:HEPN domain-containing protein
MRVNKMRKDTKDFKASAEYDLQTAEHMLNTGRYIYVIFMCHLSIEKMLKAITAETIRKTPPKTHNLIYLLKVGKIKPPNDLFEFITKINNVSIITRYPEDFSKLLEAYPKEVAQRYLNKTKEVIKCLEEDERLKG